MIRTSLITVGILALLAVVITGNRRTLAASRSTDSTASVQAPIAGEGPSPGAASQPSSIGGVFEKQGWLVGFGAVFLAGLALNLTPCVYPMIPITVGFFVGGKKDRTVLKSFLMVSVYVLGIALTYSVLGTVAGLTGSLFGSALRSPWPLGFVSASLVALALSNFGLYHLRLPAALARLAGGRRREDYLGAGLMGLTVGLVAAPCIGPFVVGLLLYVGSVGSAVFGFWVFFVLALGLGLPYLILGTFSGAAAALPGSGGWMVWVRKAFGVVLLLMAIYFLQPLLSDSVFSVLLAACLAGGGLYLCFWARSEAGGPAFGVLRYLVGIAGVAAAVLYLLPQAQGPEQIDWIPYREGILAQARQASTPVIIDFYADWCIPCKELEARTFSDPGVRQAMNRFLLVKADVTRSTDPKTEQLLKRFDVRGLPAVIFLDAKGEERGDLRLAQFVRPEEFLKRVRKFKKDLTRGGG